MTTRAKSPAKPRVWNGWAFRHVNGTYERDEMFHIQPTVFKSKAAAAGHKYDGCSDGCRPVRVEIREVE